VPAAQKGRVVAKFGYAEHGSPQAFFGTTRQETTIAVGGTVNLSNPFLFEHEITPQSGQVCTQTCAIVIPGISGRVMFYELYSNNGGALIPIPGTRTAVAVD
jgi:hypothetical protein